MAVCGLCNKETDDVDGCWLISLTSRGGFEVMLILYGDEPGSKAEPGDRCPECNALYGQPHHLGCDVEICPFCGEESAVMCQCDLEDDEGEDIL